MFLIEIVEPIENEFEVNIKTRNGMVFLASPVLYRGKRAKQSAWKMAKKMNKYLKYSEIVNVVMIAGTKKKFKEIINNGKG